MVTLPLVWLAGRRLGGRTVGLGGHAAGGHLAVRRPLRHRDPDVLAGGAPHGARVPGPATGPDPAPAPATWWRWPSSPVCCSTPTTGRSTCSARCACGWPGRHGGVGRRLAAGARPGAGGHGSRLPDLPPLGARPSSTSRPHRHAVGHPGQLRRHGQRGGVLRRRRHQRGAGRWPSSSSPWPAWACSGRPPTGSTSNSTSAPDRWAARLAVIVVGHPGRRHRRGIHHQQRLRRPLRLGGVRPGSSCWCPSGSITFRDRRVRIGVLALAVVAGLAARSPNITTNRTQAGEGGRGHRRHGPAGRRGGLLPRPAGPGGEPPAPRRSLPADHLPAGHRRRTLVNWVDYAAAAQAGVAGRLRRAAGVHGRFERPDLPGRGRPVYQTLGTKCEGSSTSCQSDPTSGRTAWWWVTTPSSTNPCTCTSSCRRRLDLELNPGTRILPRSAGDRTTAGGGDAGAPIRPGVDGGPPAWLTARVLVAATLVVAHLTVSRLRPGNNAALLRVHQGLLAWDAGWYQSIAAHGYAASGPQSAPFLPAFPMAGRVLGWLPGIGPGTGLIIVANLSALAGMAVLCILVDARVRRPRPGPPSVWLLALAPPAFTLVMAYAEGTLLLCTAVALYWPSAPGRWWWAAAAGLVAGAVRPVGLLLVVPVLLEAYRSRRAARTPPAVASRLAAVMAPAVGAGGYLAWVGSSFGDAVAALPPPGPTRAPRGDHLAVRLDGAQPGGGQPRPPFGQCRSTSPGWSSAWSCWWWPSAGSRSPTRPSRRRCWWCRWRPRTSTRSSGTPQWVPAGHRGCRPDAPAASGGGGRPGPGRGGHGRLFAPRLSGRVRPVSVRHAPEGDQVLFRGETSVRAGPPPAQTPLPANGHNPKERISPRGHHRRTAQPRSTPPASVLRSRSGRRGRGRPGRAHRRLSTGDGR